MFARLSDWKYENVVPSTCESINDNESILNVSYEESSVYSTGRSTREHQELRRDLSDTE